MTENDQDPRARSDGQTPGDLPRPVAPAESVLPPAPTPPEWAWVRPPQQMRTVETEPLEYHRLLRGTAHFRWWKSLLLFAIAGTYFGVLTVVIVLIFVPVILIADPDYATGLAEASVDILDTQRPLSILLAMVSIIIMIPSVFLAMLTMGMRPTGRVWSVAARLRWGFAGRLFGVALVSLVVMNAVGIGLGIAMDPASLSAPAAETGRQFDVNAALLSLVFIVLLVPFQSTAEEVVFRGLFMQVPGSWQRPGAHRRFRNPLARGTVAVLNSHWLVIVVPSVGFALAHIYDIWGMLAVGMMGLVAAWLTWKTGGLEAAIALHVVNNLIAFGFMTAGVGGETAQTSDAGGPASVIAEAVGLTLFVWLTLRVFSRGGHGRTRIDLVSVPIAPGDPAAGSAPAGLLPEVRQPADADGRERG